MLDPLVVFVEPPSKRWKHLVNEWIFGEQQSKTSPPTLTIPLGWRGHIVHSKHQRPRPIAGHDDEPRMPAATLGDYVGLDHVEDLAPVDRVATLQASKSFGWDVGDWIVHLEPPEIHDEDRCAIRAHVHVVLVGLRWLFDLVPSHHARLVPLVGARWPPQTLTASRHRFPIFFGIDDHFLTTELAEHVRWSAHHLLIDIERASAASTFAALLFDHCLLLPP